MDSLISWHIVGLTVDLAMVGCFAILALKLMIVVFNVLCHEDSNQKGHHNIRNGISTESSSCNVVRIRLGCYKRKWNSSEEEENEERSQLDLLAPNILGVRTIPP